MGGAAPPPVANAFVSDNAFNSVFGAVDPAPPPPPGK